MTAERAAGRSIHAPVTDAEVEYCCVVASLLPEPTYEEVRAGVDRLMMRLKHDGGRWIPSNEMTPEEIIVVRAACDDRWYVNPDGLGWGWAP